MYIKDNTVYKDFKVHSERIEGGIRVGSKLIGIDAAQLFSFGGVVNGCRKNYGKYE